jgi:hypothetical protein
MTWKLLLVYTWHTREVQKCSVIPKCLKLWERHQSSIFYTKGTMWKAGSLWILLRVWLVAGIREKHFLCVIKVHNEYCSGLSPCPRPLTIYPSILSLNVLWKIANLKITSACSAHCYFKVQTTCEKGACGKPFKVLNPWLTARQKKSVLYTENQ